MCERHLQFEQESSVVRFPTGFPGSHAPGMSRVPAFENPRVGPCNLNNLKNNTGKTSSLEEVRLVAQRTAPDALNDILDGRGEYLSTGKEYSRALDPVRDFHHSVLFLWIPLIRLILALLNAREDLLLIDEFENGLHTQRNWRLDA